MTQTPQISVVIPVWDDYTRWLPTALRSLGDQGVALTVIVVDNASTRAVPEAPQATMLHLERRVSVGAARNAGRSEERRVGKECSLLCRSRWSPYH